MRCLAAVLLLAAGCATEESEEAPVSRTAQTLSASGVSGPSAARDHGDLEPWSGQDVTIVGVFDHENFKTGVLTLASGLKVYIPHFDQFASGDDWLRHVGHRCAATGMLHTFTKPIEGYRGPSLKIYEFSGSGE